MAARKTQPSLFEQDHRLGDHLERREHGGSLRRGKRKLRRPMDLRKPLHLTLRAGRARGEWSMLRPAHVLRIKELVYRRAEMNGVRIFEYANSGNHLHILLRANSLLGFKRFLRTITGLIARRVTGAVRGRPVGKFWDELAYSRIVTWGRELFSARFYVVMNEMEASGVWSRHWKVGQRKVVPKGSGLSPSRGHSRGS